MQFLIITSTEDKASMNIRKNLLHSPAFTFEVTEIEWHDNSLFRLISWRGIAGDTSIFEENEIFLGLTNEPLIFLKDLKLSEARFNPDMLIFASRHTSKSNRPAFLVHSTGNWSENSSFGGNPWELSMTSALMIKAAFLSLEEKCVKREVGNISTCDLEVTHHGPTNLEKPLIFIELGSTPKEWNDANAGKLISNAIMNAIMRYFYYIRDKKQEIGLGFGGRHYATQFKRLIEENDVALSFICPKYYIQELDENILDQMIKNTMESVDYFIIDWKGTNSEDKRHLLPILEKYNIPVKKTKDFPGRS
ncbi:MAG: D-aminoacyl-tRNA deacylase [Promethearchaeota archaeon]